MNRKMRLGLIGKLVSMTIGCVLITAISLFCVSAAKINGTYKNLIFEELKATAEHLQSQMSNGYDGDWTMSEEGHLLKGKTDVMEAFQTEVDELKTKTDIDYSIFYGDTRVITTIMKADNSGKTIGSKAGEEVSKAVLEGGNNYYSTSLVIEGKDYFGYYSPLKNSDGTIVGMCFTGRGADDVTKAIFNVIIVLIIITVVILISVLALGLFINRTVSAKMRAVSSGLSEISSGTLSVDLSDSIANRKDELGEIGTSAKDLMQRLADIISRTKIMSDRLSASGTELAQNSDQASQSAAQVFYAVDEISKGAVSQAESVQDAVTETNNMGESINKISGDVETLNIASGKMKDNCESTKQALDVLIEQSQKVSQSVETISTTINRTDQSAKSISEFTDAINSIATQTNLLSLNASIEAARAGEAGRGFAVVAGEISNLAAQSKESADKINEIVNELMKDAGESVDVMRILTNNFAEQGKQLDATKDAMDRMGQGIGYVANSAESITKQVAELVDTRNTLNALIEDLSAISEENAASSEETNASMQELSETFSVIHESAVKLSEIAEELSATMAYFS